MENDFLSREKKASARGVIWSNYVSAQMTFGGNHGLLAPAFAIGNKGGAELFRRKVIGRLPKRVGRE